MVLADPPERLQRVLVFSKTSWYRHEAIPLINEYFVKLGKDSGFVVDATEDAAAFTPDNLKKYQVVVFNNTTDIGKSLDDSQKQAFIDWFHRGGGYLGIHSASVHHQTWPWYEQMLGTNFNSDTERQEARLIVEPQGNKHPAVAGLGPEFRFTEEWFNFESSVRGKPGTTVLLSVDEGSLKDKTVKKYFQDKGGHFMGADHPICWTRTFEGGRVFYTTFGHDQRSLETETGRRLILGALHWAAAEGK